MNTIDLILSIFLLMGFIRGFFKGFLSELAGIIALIAGIYGALQFSDIAYNFIGSIVSWDEEVVGLLAFAITFIVIVLVISLIGRMLTQMASLIALGLINRMVGAIFGLFKWAFLASLVFMILNQSDSYSLDEDQVESSVLYSPVAKIAPAVLPAIMSRLQEGEYFQWQQQASEDPADDVY